MPALSGNRSRGGIRLIIRILSEDWSRQNTLLERAVMITYRLRNWSLTRQPRIVWRIVGFILRPQDLTLRFLYRGQISSGATIGRRLRLVHAWGIMISPYAVIGDDCTLYHDVTLGNNETRTKVRAPRLDDNVYVGPGAKIIGGVKLGKDVRVGANSVVLQDVEAGCVVLGIPAKVIYKLPRAASKSEPPTAA